MQHLGESPQLTETLTNNLVHKMNALLRQGGRKVKYGEDDEEILKLADAKIKNKPNTS